MRDVILMVDSIDRRLLGKGVNVTCEVCDQAYGCRDFDVEDGNGFPLCFGQDIAT